MRNKIKKYKISKNDKMQNGQSSKKNDMGKKAE